MIPRHATDTALRLARGFPILAITGPRQSGKTTLAKSLNPGRAYVSLEEPDQRELALVDPRGFLARFPNGAVIDEAQHAQRGALFETLVVGEFVKQRFNAGQPAGLWFWRDNTGNEVDLLFESGTRLQPVEIKSGATLASDWLRGIEKWRSLVGADALPGWLVYGGDDGYSREGIEVFPWRSIGEVAGRT